MALKLLPLVIIFLFFLSIFPSTFSQSHPIGSPDRALLSPPTMIPSPSPPQSPIDKTAVAVIGATAATTLFFAGIFFVFFQKCTTRFRRRNQIESRQNIHGEETEVGVKGLIVGDNGADVYWRKLEMGHNFLPVLIEIPEEKQTKTLINHNSSEVDRFWKNEAVHDNPLFFKTIKVSPSEDMSRPIAPPPSLMVLTKQIPATPPPQPIALHKVPPPPPPPPPPLLPKRVAAAPPPPPTLPKRAPAPQPYKVGNMISPAKPPPVPKRKLSSNSRGDESIEETLKGTGVEKMKLKPLHWDKVVINVDHSLVWDEINGGSFRFDDHLMETLFGYSANNPILNAKNKVPSDSSSLNSTPQTQIFILEPRKSQNVAIVLRSLSVTRKEIIDAVCEGQGLSTDTLEKLTRIAPTLEESTKILEFKGNPSKLADAESFLFHILNTIPSAFTRFNAMLFRSSYDPEILHLKEMLQTLKLGCKELRTRGIFLKLLEAILKAGNKMNAGTSRGNAQGFNLNALNKLSDVKSTDGKTTLLHFVVEQVVRSEGRRCVLNRSFSLSRSINQRIENNNPSQYNSAAANEEREKECLMLGLPVLGGLSLEFFNVKKAATIDYDNFITAYSSLNSRVVEIQGLVTQCGNVESGGFVKEMKGFLEECEEELKVVIEEQTKVMEVVKRTTEYYQAASSKDNKPLQLFVIVKDFLDKADQVRNDRLASWKSYSTQDRTSRTTDNSEDDLRKKHYLGIEFIQKRFVQTSNHCILQVKKERLLG